MLSALLFCERDASRSPARLVRRLANGGSAGILDFEDYTGGARRRSSPRSPRLRRRRSDNRKRSSSPPPPRARPIAASAILPWHGVFYARAIEAVEQQRRSVAGGLDARLRFFERELSPYAAMVDLLVANGDAADALTFARRAKAHVIGDAKRSARRPRRPIEGEAFLAYSVSVIAPDLDLWLVPFHALLGPADRFLIERATISYASSGALITAAARREPPRVLLAANLPDGARELDGISGVWNPKPVVMNRRHRGRLQGPGAPVRARPRRCPRHLRRRRRAPVLPRLRRLPQRRAASAPRKSCA